MIVCGKKRIGLERIVVIQDGEPTGARAWAPPMQVRNCSRTSTRQTHTVVRPKTFPYDPDSNQCDGTERQILL